ncbi:hypothetical protein FDP41_008843 [Naegleria fowleri]|uniref:UvrD-like helicase ATP-binding domain-containing protein n=1 Tax=Naegleria fowleri TaxID=5763 RepID=A0A6A5BF11_NAEFO|nr:uncharacterized protein FDP41_008843 [Naegleria fowleri]KAF0972594.1 hypothetical protein FDP41_008843 [Naegleria fowleri]
MPSLGSKQNSKRSSLPSGAVVSSSSSCTTNGTKRHHSDSTFKESSPSKNKTIDSFFRKNDHQPPSSSSQEQEQQPPSVESQESSSSDLQGPTLKKQKTSSINLHHPTAGTFKKKSNPNNNPSSSSSSPSPLCTGPLDLLFQKQKKPSSSSQRSSDDETAESSSLMIPNSDYSSSAWETEWSKLDDLQRQVVHEDSAKYLMINGSHGCGKTLVVALRALHLLKNDPTRRVLVLTFSKKAEQEIHARIYKFTGFKNNQNQRIHVKTIHAFALMIMRKFADENHKTISNDDQILEIFRKTKPNDKMTNE